MLSQEAETDSTGLGISKWYDCKRLRNGNWRRFGPASFLPIPERPFEHCLWRKKKKKKLLRLMAQ